MYSAVPDVVYDSPNHGGRRARTLGVILHSTRSGRAGAALEYERTTRYMLQPDTVSSHRVIGVLEGQNAQMVEDDLTAWHAASDNREWLGIEFAQPTPSDDYTEWQIGTGVAVVVDWCRRYGIVPSERTIRRHQDTAQGKAAGKSDVGERFPYRQFIERVKAQM